MAKHPEDDAANFVIHRAKHNFVVLNRYPYTSGHVMVAPYEHIDTLNAVNEAAATELFLLAQKSEHHLRTVYHAEGINLGMNIGSCAGAGVAGHVHMHVLPRWKGDANFMSTIGETRVLPESLATTYQKLQHAYAGGAKQT
jgi:ATP adenylyltransferase